MCRKVQNVNIIIINIIIINIIIIINDVMRAEFVSGSLLLCRLKNNLSTLVCLLPHTFILIELDLMEQFKSKNYNIADLMMALSHVGVESS